MSRKRVFPQVFRVLPNFHECFYNSIGTRRTCFLFLLENTLTKKKKNSLFTLIIKMSILFVCAIITSTAHASSVFLWSYRNTVLNQSSCIFALGYFLNNKYCSREALLIVYKSLLKKVCICSN